MLHDLYLLSVYFEPTQAVLYEDELIRRYGCGPVGEAMAAGLIERFCAPCAKADTRFFCRLSAYGRTQAERMLA